MLRGAQDFNEDNTVEYSPSSGAPKKNLHRRQAKGFAVQPGDDDEVLRSLVREWIFHRTSHP
uniref:Uncharacterized protein n=1 Tax=Peronospora matthiolae TaxID=2874970 RepID=A0AAV1TZ88_9STRA